MTNSDQNNPMFQLARFISELAQEPTNEYFDVFEGYTQNLKSKIFTAEQKFPEQFVEGYQILKDRLQHKAT